MDITVVDTERDNTRTTVISQKKDHSHDQNEQENERHQFRA